MGTVYHSITSAVSPVPPPTPALRYFIDSFEDTFGLPDGESVTIWKAYNADRPGPFREPVGPWLGCSTADDVRRWIAVRHPGAVEVARTAVAR